MKMIRNNNNNIAAAIALTLLCLSFSAAPASAALDRGFEAEAGIEMNVGERLSIAVDYVQDGFSALMQKLGAIFASQSGTSIVD